MARKIKRISKRLLVSSFLFGAFVVTLFIKLFMGGNSINLSRLGSEVKELINDSNVISPARADLPPGCSSCGGVCAPGCSGCGCTCPGCGEGEGS